MSSPAALQAASPGAAAIAPAGTGISAPGDPRAAADTDIPAGLTPEQYRELRATLADHPQRDAEIARVAAYLQFTAQWQAFLQRRAMGAIDDDLRALARTLDDGLGERLAQREMTAGEAAFVKAALLEVLQPDAAARDAALKAWRAEADAAARAAAPPPDAREAEFARRQAAIVAAWQALPPAQRDAQRLEAELEALRRSVFTTPPAGGNNPAGGAR
ncbi:hypothetical protein MOJ79_06625 [Calidifontimicrobium sp. SYSU G02091]|uniref:hypothetical protein n=1 Tax=Calidifontimicrobium sp. SYSU G02091 TaxID=2926421 RepID=UPI001F52B614|nr:hypothetical protein [Calidifontimicrobium sp. SYSU G02091]MCI1191511.1 hypothetical protein [Calidifontimicrobium sp. SYSU G02091]